MAMSLAPRALIDERVLGRASRVIRVLGHPVRLRILEALEDGERHVSELVAAAGVSQASVSQQLGILRANGVVDHRREGARVYYRIVEPKVSRILDCIRECDVPELMAVAATVPLRLIPDR
jgi:ArsR family transcriptional regulator